MSSVIRLSTAEPRQSWEVPILYEDDLLLVLDLPAGLPAVADVLTGSGPNLLGLLHAGIQAGRPWALERGTAFLRNAHYLDPDQTGIVILGKTQAAADQLADAFHAGKASREFLALVRGAPESEPLVVSARLGTDQRREGFMRVDGRFGKRAETTIETAEAFKGFSLLRCRLEGDRRHQLRVHLRYARLHLVGDALYRGAPLFLSQLKRGYQVKAGQTERPLLGRAALHVPSAEFAHPGSGEVLKLSTGLAHDLEVALKYLRRYAVA